jgi:hypothetical protein
MAGLIFPRIIKRMRTKSSVSRDLSNIPEKCAMVLHTVKGKHFSPHNNGSKVFGTRIARSGARRSLSTPLGGLKNAELNMMTI